MSVTLPAQGAGDTTPTVATEAIGGTHHQLIKIEHGDAGSATPASLTNPLPITAQTPLTPAAPTFATVGVASAQALAANASRKGLTIVNTSPNQVSLGLGAVAVLGSGITLMPSGGVWEMDGPTCTTAAINAIAAAAGSNLAIQEFS